ncbi:MAG: type II toxin-antitoxin system VapB family antitoxin [Planctomycetota bacterium]
MTTNIEIDDKLLLAALKVGHHKTKEEAVIDDLKAYFCTQSKR